jgi:hypothetical protein
VVKDLFAEELAYIKQSDYNAVFRHIVTHNPSSWHPDIKSLNDAVIAFKIDMLNEPAKERKCPVCGTVNFSSGCCPVCKYAGPSDGTPEEYRKFWEDYKANRVPRLNIGDIMRRLEEKRIV